MSSTVMAHLPQLGRTDNGPPPATGQRPKPVYQIRHAVIANRRRIADRTLLEPISVSPKRSAFGERISGGAGAIADHRWPFPLRDVGTFVPGAACEAVWNLSLIHISEPTRRTPISYAV